MLDSATPALRDSSSASALDVLCSDDDGPRRVVQVTIVAAHPDDEVIGAGGRMPHLRDVHVVHVTDGAPRNMTDAIASGFATREDYARARASERERALSLARITSDRIHDVGLVDQEASFTMAGLTSALIDLFTAIRSDIVLTHAYEGGHPDHDATAFAVHSAKELMRRDGLPSPVVMEFTGYHWWGGTMRTGHFVPHPATPIRTVSLGNPERQLKRAMVSCYESQGRVLASFRIDTESFRVAPEYDFTSPPHEGRLFYESFDWRVTGAEWRRLAERALHEIGSPTTPC